MTEQLGLHFSFNEQSGEVKFFCDKGKKVGDNIHIIDENTERETIINSPIGQVEEIVSQEEEIEFLLISSQVAVGLFLEGIITPDHFERKIEDDNSLTLLGVAIMGTPHIIMIRDTKYVGKDGIRAIIK